MSLCDVARTVNELESFKKFVTRFAKNGGGFGAAKKILAGAKEPDGTEVKWSAKFKAFILLMRAWNVERSKNTKIPHPLTADEIVAVDNAKLQLEAEIKNYYTAKIS